VTASIFNGEMLAPEAAGNPGFERVLESAGDRGGQCVRNADILAALVLCAEPVVGGALRAALVPGAGLRDVLGAIDVYAPTSTSATIFDGRRQRFAPATLAALDELDARLAELGDQGARVAVELLAGCVLRHLEKDDRDALEILDAAAAAESLDRRARTTLEPPPPLIDLASDRLRSEEFSSSSWTVLEHAAAHAGELGHDRVLAPHLLHALLGEPEGPADHVVRLEGRPDAGPLQVATALADAFRLTQGGGPELELDRHRLGDATIALLEHAQREARYAAAERVETHHLLVALLESCPPRLATVLLAPPLSLDLERMRRRAAEIASSAPAGERDTPFRLPTGVLPSEDLTHRARTDPPPPALHVDASLEPILRALCRRSHNHVLITAAAGVGATTLLRELARRAASGEIRPLARKRMLWVDCAHVIPQESKDKLAAVLAHVAARTDVILCLDGLGPLMRGPAGETCKADLRAALAAGKAQIVAVMSPPDFKDLLSSDPTTRDFFTRVELAEPSGDEAIEIVSQDGAALSAEYGFAIEPAAIRRSIALTTSYMLSERLPGKAIRVLRRACEDVDYAREQCGEELDGVTAANVVGVVAQLTGIATDTLSGIAGKVDYVRELSTEIVGQREAVEAAAAELRNINAGVVEPGRPASVMLFAGLTGVGKTELAKRLALLYSASRRLQTYTMANFTEPHTVSGIVGVPPGYVGHDQGGRLVNDLNADPYSVFLLDEAEKAHPEVWKPFLNLFDEGWVVDQRGTKAFADRAIFILTSNVGQEIIARMTRNGSAMADIVPRVRDALAEERHARTGQLVFPPEFLARIGRILIFKPLDAGAMEMICRLGIERAKAGWRQKDRELVVDDELIVQIASEAHRRDREARFTEGGRIVRRLIADYVHSPVTAALSEDEHASRTCSRIGVRLDPRSGGGLGDVRVELRTDPAPSRREALLSEAQALSRLAAAGTSIEEARDATAACERRIERRAGAAASNGVAGHLRATAAELESLRARTREDCGSLLAGLADHLVALANGDGDDG
jgi:ATP-dependent Clp protease ATP-binding subunit ClpC